MQRASFQPGVTPASRIKTLVLHLDRKGEHKIAEEILEAVRFPSEELENETKPIGLALWHKAVVAFCEKKGRPELDEVWPSVIDPVNMAVWSPVLRGTETPEQAYKQLDSFGSEGPRSTRWETLSCEPGHWRGRLFVAHDPVLEKDGLLSAARAAELRAISVMFGLPPAKVSVVAMGSSTLASRSGVALQEFDVTWTTSYAPVWPYSCAGGGVLGLGVAALSLQPLVMGGGAAAGALAGALGGIVWYRERVKRAEAEARARRLSALERGLSLRENRTPSGYEPGAVIAGMYRLGPRLGSGASGVIHEATRLSDNVRVAIKLLRAAVAHDSIASDRLRREAEAMGLAWHPNVVELLDQGVLSDGTTYLTMERLHGETLATRLQRVRQLPPEDVAQVASQICDALGAIHAAGVIHRDLKPSNIFICQAQPKEGELIKLIDFGIARVEWAETRLTAVGAAVGTPGYMSPEQEMGGEVDSRSDIFALGALLFACLTGEELTRPMASPVRGAPLPETLSAAQKAQLPPGWDEIIAKAMAPLPRDRFLDAKAMKDAINTCVSGKHQTAPSHRSALRALPITVG